MLFKRINAQGNKFLLEFVLDKSLGHLAPIHFNWDQGYRCGDLRIGLNGGVVLSSTNAFTVLQWDDVSASTSYGYDSIPDPDMWSMSFKSSSPANSSITLADGYKQGDLDMNGITTASFTAMSMGHVTLSNIRTNRLINLVVSMDVNEVDKSVSEIVADMVAAGYTNSVVKDVPPYDLQLYIPAADVVDKSIDDLSYFAWDFTDPTTLATNATVNAISFEFISSPAEGSVIIVH